MTTDTSAAIERATALVQSGAWVPIVPAIRHYVGYRVETYRVPDGTVRSRHLYSDTSGRFALVYDSGRYATPEEEGAGPWRRYTQVLLYGDRGEAATPVLSTTYPRHDGALALARAWVNDGE